MTDFERILEAQTKAFAKASGYKHECLQATDKFFEGFRKETGWPDSRQKFTPPNDKNNKSYTAAECLTPLYKDAKYPQKMSLDVNLNLGNVDIFLLFEIIGLGDGKFQTYFMETPFVYCPLDSNAPRPPFKQFIEKILHKIESDYVSLLQIV